MTRAQRREVLAAHFNQRPPTVPAGVTVFGGVDDLEHWYVRDNDVLLYRVSTRAGGWPARQRVHELGNVVLRPVLEGVAIAALRAMKYPGMRA